MTTETIEWYSPEEQLPPGCPPGMTIPVLVILKDDRCVTDQRWNGTVFMFPDHNACGWMQCQTENVKLWALCPKGNDNAILLPGNGLPRLRRFN